MNYCTSCGNKLTEDTIFCPKCGLKVRDLDTESTKEPQTVSSDEMKEKLTNTYTNAKETVKESQYVHYFMESVKRPTSALDSDLSTYGWIQLVLLTLVATLSMYGILSGLIKMSLNEVSLLSSFGSFGIEDGILSVLRSQIVPRLIIINLVTFLTFAISAFLVLKVVGKSEQSFSQLLTEYSGLLSPNVIGLFIVSVLSLLFASELTVGLSIIILFLSFLLCFAAYNFYLYSRVNNEKIDKMYVLLLSNLLVFILLGILVFIQIEPMITFFQQLEHQVNTFW